MTEGNREEDEKRQYAKQALEELFAKGRDPHEACCMLIYDLLHVDADVAASEYISSFINWAFEGNAAERDRWLGLVKSDINGDQQSHDFKKEGF